MRMSFNLRRRDGPFQGLQLLSGQFIPVFFEKQILPGTFEYTLSYLIDNEVDISLFEDTVSALVQ